jgi:hypothetical protein
MLLMFQVRDFHACIGRETRAQCLEKFGGKPDILMACVGGGSNAIGLFHEFINDLDVRMIGVEAGGCALSSEIWSAGVLNREQVRPLSSEIWSAGVLNGDEIWSAGVLNGEQVSSEIWSVGVLIGERVETQMCMNSIEAGGSQRLQTFCVAEAAF